MKGIATLIGLGITGMTIYGKYASKSSVSPGVAGVYALCGYDIGGTNTPTEVIQRLAVTYGPLAGGITLTKVSGRYGVNRALPKGINL